MSTKIIKIDKEEFPESILNAPKTKFLKPKKVANFSLLIEEKEDLSCNKEVILEKNFQKCIKNEQDVHSKFAKRKILEYMKKMSSGTLHDSNSQSRSDSGEFSKNEQDEKLIFFPDFKL